MRAVVQRVKKAEVRIEGCITGSIGPGLLIFLGVEENDTENDVLYMTDKIVNLRIFEDANKKMNLSLMDVSGSILIVSQFTLCGDCRKGRRPSFIKAARPEKAVPLYEKAVDMLRASGLRVETGEFQAMMDVELVNYGPVTILLDSSRLF